MSYSVVLLCTNIVEKNTARNRKIAAGVDIVVVVFFSVIGGLLLNNALNTPLATKISETGYRLSLGLICSAGAITLVNMITIIIHKILKIDNKHLRERIHETIIQDNVDHPPQAFSPGLMLEMVEGSRSIILSSQAAQNFMELSWSPLAQQSRCVLEDDSGPLPYMSTMDFLDPYLHSYDLRAQESSAFTVQTLNARLHSVDYVMGGLYIGDVTAFRNVLKLFLFTDPKSGELIPGSNPYKFETVITIGPLSRLGGKALTPESIATDFGLQGIKWLYLPQEHVVLSKEVIGALDAAILGRKTLIHCDTGITDSANVLRDYFVLQHNVRKEDSETFLQNKIARIELRVDGSNLLRYHPDPDDLRESKE